MGTGGSPGRRLNCHIQRHPVTQTPMRPSLLELFEISELNTTPTKSWPSIRTERLNDAGASSKVWRPETKAVANSANSPWRSTRRGRGRPPLQTRSLPDLAVRWVQSWQVRILLGRDQRQTATDVHDADVDIRRDEIVTVTPMDVSGDSRSLFADVSFNYQKRARSRLSRHPDYSPAKFTEWRKSTLRSQGSASALNASCAKTSAS